MNILAFDTSGAHCAAALVAGDAVLAAREESMTRGQAERLLPMLEALLAEAGLGWEGLDALAVGVGPGSFTGIRVSVATGRALALALGRPALGVSLFEARARALPRPLAVVEPMGRVRLAAAVAGPAGVGAPITGEADEIASALPEGLAGVTGAGAEAVAARRALPALAPAEPLAVAIGRAAAERLGALPEGASVPPPAPLYLRAPNAAPARTPAAPRLP